MSDPTRADTPPYILRFEPGPPGRIAFEVARPGRYVLNIWSPSAWERLLVRPDPAFFVGGVYLTISDG